MTTHKMVMEAWIKGQPAKGNSLSTDGRRLYSYSLPVARYGWSEDMPVVANYTAAGGAFMSITTSKQIRQIVKFLDQKRMDCKIILPEAFEEGDY